MDPQPINKVRRESFGAILYSENPGFTAFVDAAYADSLGIPAEENLPRETYRAPLDVHLSITQRCNLNCPGCYAVSPSELPKEMPFELAARIIDHLASLSVFTVALGGGEPLLHPDWCKIARYARSRQIVPNLTSNGLLIDSETARSCRVFGSIHLSCHHPQELNRLSDTVRLLQREGLDPGLNVLLSSQTFPHIPEIWKWCSQHAVRRVLALQFKITKNNLDYQSWRLTEDQQRDLYPTIVRWSRKYGVLPLLDCSLFPLLALHHPKKKDLEFFDVAGCQGGNAYIAITPEGHFKPCSFCEPSSGPIEMLDRHAWISMPHLQSFRQSRCSPDCTSCDYLPLCNGGCRIHTLDLGVRP
ncbi:MAG: radical SAM protein [Pirellulales bacterium]|nr:radical SAM protein [Pirellulales bacterium]